MAIQLRSPDKGLDVLLHLVGLYARIVLFGAIWTRAGLAYHNAEFIHEHRWRSEPLDYWIISYHCFCWQRDKPAITRAAHMNDHYHVFIPNRGNLNTFDILHYILTWNSLNFKFLDMIFSQRKPGDPWIPQWIPRFLWGDFLKRRFFCLDLVHVGASMHRFCMVFKGHDLK